MCAAVSFERQSAKRRSDLGGDRFGSRIQHYRCEPVPRQLWEAPRCTQKGCLPCASHCIGRHSPAASGLPSRPNAVETYIISSLLEVGMYLPRGGFDRPPIFSPGWPFGGGGATKGHINQAVITLSRGRPPPRRVSRRCRGRRRSTGRPFGSQAVSLAVNNLLSARSSS